MIRKVLFSLLILSIFSSCTESTEDRIAKINNLENKDYEELSLRGKLYQLYKYNSDYTNLQRDNAEEKIKGKIIKWRLPIYEISKAGKHKYNIQFDSVSKRAAVSAILYTRNKKEDDYIASLKTGMMISFKGEISGVDFLRSIEVNPAILFYKQKKQINNINNNLKILRNLPYAKRGYIFKSNDLMKFYKSQSWYHPNIQYSPKLSDLTNPEQNWRNRIIQFKTINSSNFSTFFNEYIKKFIKNNQNINNLPWLSNPKIIKNIKYKGFIIKSTLENKHYENLIPRGTKGTYIQLLKNGNGYFLPLGKKKNDLIVGSQKVMEGGLLYMEFLDSNNEILDTCYQNYISKCKYLRHWSEYKHRIENGF